MDKSAMLVFVTLLWSAASCVEGTRLLLTSINQIEMVDADRGASNGTVLLKRLHNAYALDFLYEDSLIFWADFDLNTINRVSLNDTANPTVILKDDINDVTGLAVDWIGRKLYWADRGLTQISVSSLDGKQRKVVYDKDLDHLWALALDPRHGFMYWTQWGWNGRIERAGMNGEERTRSVVVNDGIRWAYGLALDYTASTIYWTDIAVKDLQSCDYDGENRRHIEQGISGLSYPYGVTVDNQLVYWTDASSRSIYACNKLTFTDCFFVYSTARPWDLKAYAKDKQPPGRNMCGNNNGGCSDLCLLSPVPPYYSCVCDGDNELMEDGKTCGQVAKKPLTPFVQSSLESSKSEHVSGRSYTLSCRSDDEGTAEMEYNFIKDGTPMGASTENYYVIYGAKPRDAGQYQCQTILNSVYSNLSPVLEVKVKEPETRLSAPTLQSNQNSICRMYVRDQRYTLTCTTSTVVDGLLYSFIKDGAVLKSSTENIYVLDYASKSDNGRYECKVFTSRVESERSNVVEIQLVEPHLRATARPGAINASEPLTIACVFDHETCASNSVNLLSISLAKTLPGRSQRTALASISTRQPDRVQVKGSYGARFKGKINDGSVSVLQAVWEKPTSEEGGSYTCLASLRNSKGSVVIMAEQAQVLGGGGGGQCPTACTSAVPVLQKQVLELQTQMTTLFTQFMDLGQQLNDMQVASLQQMEKWGSQMQGYVGAKQNQQMEQAMLLQDKIIRALNDTGAENNYDGPYNSSTIGFISALNNGARYWIPSEKAANFSAAQATCNKYGAGLADIEEETEWKTVQNFYKQANPDGVGPLVIGGRYLPSQGQFAWANSGSPFTFTAWSKGEPDNLGTEDCVQIFAHNYGWDTIACNFPTPRSFICEISQ